MIRTLVDVPALAMTAGTVMLQAAPLPWDGFALELWAALLNGGRCVLMEAGLAVLDPAALRSAIDRGVNTLFLTTALFGVLSDDVPELFETIDLLMVGGERVIPGHVRRVLQRCSGLRFVHCYGPAESTILTTVHLVRARDVDESPDDIPLGDPVPHTGVVLLDEAGTVTGGAGEIAISGTASRSGTWAIPRRPRRRLVHLDGVRHYRTGDLAVCDGEDRLRYRSRLDQQIKLNGVRVEPGEVDAVLSSHPAVGAAYTVLIEPRPGRRALASVYKTRSGAEVDAETIRQFAARRLLAAMLPEVIVQVPALPLGSTGKTDKPAVRRAVLAAAGPAPSGGQAADELLILVREALGLPGLGSHGDFLDAGGHVTGRYAAVCPAGVAAGRADDHGGRPSPSCRRAVARTGAGRRAGAPARRAAGSDVLPLSPA